MTTTINASTSSGLVVTPDNSGTIQLQSNGTTVATASSSGFSYSGGVIQVVSSLIGTTQSTTAVNASPASTTLTATITPKFSTSRIYILVSSVGGQSTGGRSAFFYIFKNGSSQMRLECNDTSYTVYYPICISYMDSPATTSATTYAVYFATDGAGTNYFANANSPSTITLMEIAA